MRPRARISGVSVTLDGPQHVCVEVPATTANFGPGFDCLGMALQLHDRLHFYQRTGMGPIITSQGPVRSYCELAHTAASSLFQHLGKSIPALEVQVENNIPIARGLGSSAAAIVGGLVAANRLTGNAVDMNTVLDLAVKIEGHPDNVTPALLGGFRVMVQSEGRLYNLKVSIPESLKAVLFIPNFLMPTEESRKLLPKELSREDAVHNISRAALLVASLANEEMSYLDVATKDKLHQPARSRFFPAMDVIFKAALDAGAKGAFLSGGGPTILALAVEDEEPVGRAMLAAAETEGISGEIKITRPSQDGARVVE